MPAKRYETIAAKQVLNRVKVESMPFDWSINPYRGCAHGCSFCYARGFQSFLGKEPNDEFQNHIFLKTNAADALERQLARIAKSYGARPEATGPLVGSVAIGTATDPYQPIEGKAGITRSILAVLAKYRVPTSVTTRSPLILRDVDLLERMDVTSINISVSTLDPDVTRKLEPATPNPAKRLETVEALAARGLPAGVFIAPILPFLTDDEASLDALFASAKRRGAAFAMTSLLRLSPDVKPWYFRTLEMHFPELTRRYAALYDKAYARADYAESMRTLLARLSAKHGLDGRVPERPAAPAPGSVADGRIGRTASAPEAIQLTFSF